MEAKACPGLYRPIKTTTNVYQSENFIETSATEYLRITQNGRGGKKQMDKGIGGEKNASRREMEILKTRADDVPQFCGPSALDSVGAESTSRKNDSNGWKNRAIADGDTSVLGSEKGNHMQGSQEGDQKRKKTTARRKSCESGTLSKNMRRNEHQTTTTKRTGKKRDAAYCSRWPYDSMQNLVTGRKTGRGEGNGK